MPNIKLNYLYRDAGNYKNYSSVVFGNKDQISVASVNQIVNKCLIDDEFFYANEWQVPDLHFAQWDNDLDHTFHEFESIELTDEQSNCNLDISEWLKSLQSAILAP
ncbi:hypothetical protein [Mucilaginibacter ginkgonis]|uniref:Uncharacterized protein n=1 Tax=Mucilaginibacter ginkgonis TaxID=2682091 RepID=A0A6I4I5I4_9SPHI|nr:hypothetical protein [Mucilaginibacter ginkgonis]QQL49127.1 hypothetical protein GO620_013205 [Mucilaginibacter ginkgonis]